MASPAGFRQCIAFLLACPLILLLNVQNCSGESPNDGYLQSAWQQTSPGTGNNGKNTRVVLELGKVIERRISGGDTHLYRVDLTAGEFMHVLLDQRGVDVVETLSDPSGREVMKVDYHNGMYGPQFISFVAEIPGVYILRVKKLAKGAVGGVYAISLSELREATPPDRRRVVAGKNLIDAGRLLQRQGRSELDEALKQCAAAHDFFKDSDYAYQDAMSLEMSGSASSLLGNIDAAQSFYEQASFLYVAVGDRVGQARMINEIGAIYFAQGKNDAALEAYNKALELYRAVGDQMDEAMALVDIGRLHRSMGDGKTALEYYKRAIPILEKVKFDGGRASAFLNIAQVQISMGDLAQALKTCEKALYYFHKAGDRRGVAVALDRIGWLYFLSGERDEALKNYSRSLSMSRDGGDRTSELITLNNFAWVRFQSGEERRALSQLMDALEISREIGIRRSEAGILGNIMVVWNSLGNRDAAIFFGKQAVNLYQTIRSQSQTLDRELQKSFLHSNENVYRTLAELLVSTGRLSEAQQILDMLKEDEYFEYLRRQSGSPFKSVAITASEIGADKSVSDVSDRITAVGRAINELQAKGDLTDEEKKRLAGLKAQLDVEKKNYQKTLEGLGKMSGESKSGGAGGSLDSVLNTESLMSSTLRDLGHGTVALYTIQGEDEYTVILFTQDVPVSRKYKIKAVDLNRKIMAFRQILEDPNRDPLPLAQELYKIIIGPIASNLKAIEAKTLMWSFDGLLRYVPVAALHDGEKYMVERYQNVVFTPASYARLRDRNAQRDWHVLGLGVTKAVDKYPALPGVKEELSGIVRREGETETGVGVMPGVVLLDDDFTEEGMEQALLRKYQVVHIASHFNFEPGNNRKSSLLLGDGKYMLVSDVANSLNLFDRVELLTLSACNTALGGPDASGADLENFAVLAQNKGAKAVTATLWSVADVSTSLLMRKFYRLLDENPWMPKSEALRQAQSSLLHGESEVNIPTEGERGAEIMSKKSSPEPVGAFNTNPKAPYAHPYFWAPFILIGNWQ